MKLKRITLNGEIYIVQSYKKYCHANIISDNDRLSFTIDLANKKVDGSYGLQNEYWKEKAGSINVSELINVLEKFQ
jgi:hypothetical protein